jgi:hypothetical protein
MKEKMEKLTARSTKQEKHLTIANKKSVMPNFLAKAKFASIKQVA